MVAARRERPQLCSSAGRFLVRRSHKLYFRIDFEIIRYFLMLATREGHNELPFAFCLAHITRIFVNERIIQAVCSFAFPP